MSDFKPIETQEQLDSIITERISRAKESVRKEFEGFISPSDLEAKTKDLNGQISSLQTALNESNEKIKGFDAQIAERDTKIKAYELGSVKTKIASELGLPLNAIDYIQGDSEESIRTSAEGLKTMFGASAMPKASNEPVGGYSTEEAKEKAMFSSMLNNLNK